jgi:hypothetical protein
MVSLLVSFTRVRAGLPSGAQAPEPEVRTGAITTGRRRGELESVRNPALSALTSPIRKRQREGSERPDRAPYAMSRAGMYPQIKQHGTALNSTPQHTVSALTPKRSRVPGYLVD